MGVLWSQKDACEKLTEGRVDGTVIGQKLDGGVAVQLRDGSAAGGRQSVLARLMLRRAIRAGRADDWSELLKSSELNPWTRVKLQECCCEVRQGDDQRTSTVQQIMQKSTDFL